MAEGGAPTNLIGVDPAVVLATDTSVSLFPWRANPNFVGAHIVVLDQTLSELGDYHLTNGSIAINAGTRRVGQGQNQVDAPAFDYDHQARPYPSGNNNYDIGADEFSTGPVIRTFIRRRAPNGGAADDPLGRPVDPERVDHGGGPRPPRSATRAKRSHS